MSNPHENRHKRKLPHFHEALLLSSRSTIHFLVCEKLFARLFPRRATVLKRLQEILVHILKQTLHKLIKNMSSPAK